jgi:quercetin dioxygenase-like cupin family protein
MNEKPGSQGAAVPTGEVLTLKQLIEYSDGSVVSRTLIDNAAGTLTLFAFDADQGLSEHSAPFDAVVQVIDGQVEVVVGGEKLLASSGDMVIMPANVPHSMRSSQRFKMLLTMLRT